MSPGRHGASSIFQRVLPLLSMSDLADCGDPPSFRQRSNRRANVRRLNDR